MANTWEDYLTFFLTVCSWLWKPACLLGFAHLLIMALGTTKAWQVSVALVLFKWGMGD